jgi:hypothetical protein
MTPQKEHEDGKEGILEQMLQSLRAIGQNVERVVYRLDFYSTGAGRRTMTSGRWMNSTTMRTASTEAQAF